MILIRLSPDRLGLGLDAALSAKNCNRTVKNSQGALDLNGEIDVTRGVDDVDTVVLPETGRSSGSDGYTTLLLLLHPVHRCGAIVGLTDFMSFSRIKQDTLGCGSFTGIDVRHDTDVSGHLKGYLSWHINLRISVKLKI